MSDDEEQYNPKSHKSLLQAISSLGKAQHIRKSVRSEPQQHQDEFQLIKRKASSAGLLDTPTPQAVDAEKRSSAPVGVNDIVQVLKTTKTHLDAGKQLKNVQSTKKVLQKPLEKPAADRIKRTVGYESVKKKLEKWDAVVAKNRSAETQVFPLKTETIYMDTSAQGKPFKTSLKSALELEMEATEAKLRTLKKQAAGDNTNEEDLANKEAILLQQKLTRDELTARRRELAYLKMRESQQSAKFRLKNKIKSKKYHKLLKRQKLLDEMKQFELLQKTNPEAALEKLNALEKSRVLERASLRHKNTGTWAKNLQVRAKYDKDVRKDLSEQLQISRQLTEKKNVDTDDSNDEENQENEIAQQCAAEEPVDAFNPWTKVMPGGKNVQESANTDNNWRKYWLERNQNDKLLQSYYEEIKENEKEQSTTSAEHKPTAENIEQNSNAKPIMKTRVKENKKRQITSTKTEEKPAKSQKKKRAKVENGWIVEELDNISDSHVPSTASIDDIFDAQEDLEQMKMHKKIKSMAMQAQNLAKTTTKVKKVKKSKAEKNALKNLNDLSFKNDKNKVSIDEELNHDADADETQEELLMKAATSALTREDKRVKTSQTAASVNDDTIDPSSLASIKSKTHSLGENINIALDCAEHDLDMDEEDHNPRLTSQQMTISEAFEDDDIVADFSKDKSKESELKNTEIELGMPGWGSWAGAGISKERQNRKRMILKLNKPADKRRDENKGNVYINENVEKNLRTHLVSDVPFPFTSLADYEASIRAPVGRTFVPETAFRKLTRPAVITHKGKIIEPMDESELVKPQRRPNNVVDARIARMAAAK